MEAGSVSGVVSVVGAGELSETVVVATGGGMETGASVGTMAGGSGSDCDIFTSAASRAGRR